MADTPCHRASHPTMVHFHSTNLLIPILCKLALNTSSFTLGVLGDASRLRRRQYWRRVSRRR